MNPRRIVRTLIVMLVAIVGRWLLRVPLASTPNVAPTQPPPPPAPLVHLPEPWLEPLEAPQAIRPPNVPFPESIHGSATSAAVLDSPVAVLERPGAIFETDVAVRDSPVPALETHPAFETSGAGEEHVAPEAPVAQFPTPGSFHDVPDDATETSVAQEPHGWDRDWHLPEREPEVAAADADDDAPASVAAHEPTVEAHELTIDAPAPNETTRRPAHASGSVDRIDSSGSPGIEPPMPPEARRTRRRSDSSERPGRLLGGAGFLLAAIACFIASFVLFVRLTTPDRSAPTVYAVVPYVAASERNVPPALASFAGEIATEDMWLVLRLPVAARYVALTGLRTVDRWTTTRFTLAGTKPTLGSNAASCYSGAGVANGPPELTPLPAGLVIRDDATTSLAPERLVRVDVGALLVDATSTKTLVCAIASPARTGFASYAATIGVPNVPATDATSSRVKLSALPLGVDFSTFGDASAMRFTQTSLAVATDPLHATLDVAGFETFAYDDPEGDARRDVLLFIAGALATIGAVAVADALRPWLGIERR